MVKILTLALALTLAGCQTTKGSFCEISSPVRLSSEAIKSLSDQEVRTLLAHNRKGQKLCGWRP